MRPTSLSTLVLLFAVVPAGLAAQAAETPVSPEGWRMVTDRVSADTSRIDFARMEPGFHVTTGPAAILFHPDSTAEGEYRVEATAHLFAADDAESGYGIFLEGAELEGAYQRYVSFLMRASGEFLVRNRDSPTSWADLAGWETHPAVRGLSDRADGAASVANELARRGRLTG